MSEESQTIRRLDERMRLLEAAHGRLRAAVERYLHELEHGESNTRILKDALA